MNKDLVAFTGAYFAKYMDQHQDVSKVFDKTYTTFTDAIEFGSRTYRNDYTFYIHVEIVNEGNEIVMLIHDFGGTAAYFESDGFFELLISYFRVLKKIRNVSTVRFTQNTDHYYRYDLLETLR
ncbi:hypothetical protein G7061_09865 [Erysipelothrix sp. HDW6B]|uniref:hypothetical protein n=1 Tax=Erysipelothrix sp. HDW6B TaxID=2714929 RepID=UPI00140B578F|nr:hypothetical protein [Erysipelothrix sp. HDW6B]QIK86902.1 hypothetical protein G7061_09865 [Erysipelothrix sp. HDW6B]